MAVILQCAFDLAIKCYQEVFCPPHRYARIAQPIELPPPPPPSPLEQAIATDLRTHSFFQTYIGFSANSLFRLSRMAGVPPNSDQALVRLRESLQPRYYLPQDMVDVRGQHHAVMLSAVDAVSFSVLIHRVDPSSGATILRRYTITLSRYTMLPSPLLVYTNIRYKLQATQEVRPADGATPRIESGPEDITPYTAEQLGDMLQAALQSGGRVAPYTRV